MNKEQLLGLVRHVLTGFGGAAASTGYITESDYTLAVGAIVTLAGIIWSAFAPEKKK